MQRGNYRNIGNSFVSGGVQQQQSPMAQRQTRSNPAPVAAQQQPTPFPASPVVPSNNIQIKTETAPVTTPTPMQLESPNEEEIKDMDDSESDLLKLKKINFKKKVSGKEKRSKQNKKLYRMLTPRNAIAALNELTVGQAVGDTVVVPIQGSKFEAEVVLHNVKYKGQGTSKMAAKNNACEKALRDLIINKFRQAKQQDAVSVASEDVNMEDPDNADVPMLQLASFALHKLFSEWEAEGFEVPFPKTENPQAAVTPPNAAVATETSPKVPAAPKPPKVKNELPPNSTAMHPVMLLSVMRPCTQYNDLGSQGITPNIMHTVGATVDGQSFIGQGRSKKEARKRVATQILQKLFEWKGSCC